jgi:hypothetical protein
MSQCCLSESAEEQRAWSAARVPLGHSEGAWLAVNAGASARGEAAEVEVHCFGTSQCVPAHHVAYELDALYRDSEASKEVLMRILPEVTDAWCSSRRP